MKVVKDYVIQYGNCWLMTDDMQTEIKWVNDRAEASNHTYIWAMHFEKQMKKEGKTVYIMTLIEALKKATQYRFQELRSFYFYAIQAEVIRLLPGVDFDGVSGAPPYAFSVDPAFAKGIPAKIAALNFVIDYASRNKKFQLKVPDNIQGYASFVTVNKKRWFSKFGGGLTSEYSKAEVFSNPLEAMKAAKARNPNSNDIDFLPIDGNNELVENNKEEK